MRVGRTRVAGGGRRGNALLLAILSTLLLFIMGLVFVSSMMTEKSAAEAADTDQLLGAATDKVVADIQDVLVRDLFGKQLDKGLLDGTAGNEAWDYPSHTVQAGDTNAPFDDMTIDPGPDDIWGPPYDTGTPPDHDEGYWHSGNDDDPWLADLEPVILTGQVEMFDPASGNVYMDFGPPEVLGWRHITDLYGSLATAFAYGYNYKNDTMFPLGTAFFNGIENAHIDPEDPQNLLSTPIDRVSFRNLRASIIDPAAPAWFGRRADADGDGVADSRWVVVPDVKGPEGERYYTAVRIIDNSAMINLNTAYRNPSVLATPEDWDGSRLTDINLLGIRKAGPDVPADLHFVRQYTDYDTTYDPSDATFDKRYNRELAIRIDNPHPVPTQFYAPFDVMEELSLRNRFLLGRFYQDVNGDWQPVLPTRAEIAWQVTLNPYPPPGSYSYGRMLPFDDPGDMGAWFNKARLALSGSGSQYYSARHIVTTCSYTSTAMPKTADFPPTWTPGPLTVGIDEMPTELADALATWTNWNSLNQGQWRYRPIGVTDYVKANIPQLTDPNLVAAAIWLALPEKGPAPSNDYYGFDKVPNGYSWSHLTRDDLACQIAVNLIDYMDSDHETTTFRLGGSGKTYFGYEAGAESAFISEVVIGVHEDNMGKSTTYYAIELFSFAGADINNWSLDIDGTVIPLSGTVPAGSALGSTLVLWDSDDGSDPDGNFGTDTNLAGLEFSDNERIVLIRDDGYPVDGVDVGTVPTPDPDPGMAEYEYIDRGNWVIDGKLPVWRTNPGWSAGDDLGSFSPEVADPSANKRSRIQAICRDDDQLTTIGELGMVLGIAASEEGGDYQTLPEWYNSFRTAGDLPITAGRMDFTHPEYADLLRYFAVDGFNPSRDFEEAAPHDPIDNDGNGAANEARELAVAGRININTAPWFVIKQLPWVGVTTSGPPANTDALAHAIWAYRDKIDFQAYLLANYGITDTDAPIYAGSTGRATQTGLAYADEEPGFKSLSQVTQVINTNGTWPNEYDIRKYAQAINSSNTPDNLSAGPDYSPVADTVPDDIEERDILFQRISNLATVRSDVFTAYILVRMGEVGPQRRYIAIFDRTNVFGPGQRPRVVALHPVPDPR